MGTEVQKKKKINWFKTSVLAMSLATIIAVPYALMQNVIISNQSDQINQLNNTLNAQALDKQLRLDCMFGGDDETRNGDNAVSMDDAERYECLTYNETLAAELDKTGVAYEYTHDDIAKIMETCNAPGAMEKKHSIEIAGIGEFPYTCMDEDETILGSGIKAVVR